jgi:hypothetical protein
MMLLTFWTQNAKKKTQKTKLFSFPYKLRFSELLASGSCAEVCCLFGLLTFQDEKLTSSNKLGISLVLQAPRRETNASPLHAYPVKIASTAGKNLALSIPVSMNEP